MIRAIYRLGLVKLLVAVGLTLLVPGCKKKQVTAAESRCVRLCKKIKDCGVGRSSSDIAKCKAGCLDHQQKAPERFQTLWMSIEPVIEQTCDRFTQRLAAAQRSMRTNKPEPESKPVPVENVPCHKACAKLVECFGIEVVGDVARCARQCHAEIQDNPLQFARKWKLLSPHLDSPCPEFRKAVRGEARPAKTGFGPP